MTRCDLLPFIFYIHANEFIPHGLPFLAQHSLHLRNMDIAIIMSLNRLFFFQIQHQYVCAYVKHDPQGKQLQNIFERTATHIKGLPYLLVMNLFAFTSMCDQTQ